MRVARAIWLLQQAPMSARELAQRLEISPHGARAMLRRLSVALPLTYEAGKWWIVGELLN